MNFNADFSDIRSLFYDANKNIAELPRLDILLGNRDEIVQIVENLQTLLSRHKCYIDQHDHRPLPQFEHELRRILFYLMLNTSQQFRAPHDVEQHPDVAHLLNDMVQMPCFLFLCVMWSLRLAERFAEALLLTPVWFAVEFAAGPALVNALRASQTPRSGWSAHAKPIVVACFRRVCTGESDDEQAARFAETVTQLIVAALSVTDGEIAAAGSRTRRHKLLGHTLLNGLQTALACLAAQTGDNPPVAPTARQVFGIMDDETRSDSPAHHPRNPVQCKQMLDALLNALDATAARIDLGAFVAWTEIDLTDELNMQRAIGEAAFHFNNRMRGEPAGLYAMDACDKLRSLEMAPRTLPDILHQASMGDIMTRLDADELEPAVRSAWLTEFLSRGILVFGNDECLDTLQTNVPHLNMDHAWQMCQQADELAAALDDGGAQLRQLIVDVVRCTLSDSEALKLVQLSLQQRPPFGLRLELDSFGEQCVELFNRCSPGRLRSAQTYALLVQNPKRFVERALEAALVSDRMRLDICAFVGGLPGLVTRRFVADTLMGMLRTHCDGSQAERGRLAAMLVHFHGSEFLSLADFFRQLTEALLSATHDHRWQSVGCQLTVLHEVARQLDVPETSGLAGLCDQTLATLAVLLDELRWDLRSFATSKADVLHQAIGVLHTYRNLFLPSASDEQLERFAGYASNSSPHTAYYYRCGPMGQEPRAPDDYATVVCDELRTSEPNVERDIELLLGLMVRCTRRECLMLANNARLRPYWFMAMRLIARVVQRSEQLNSEPRCWDCVRYVSQSLAHVVQAKLCAGLDWEAQLAIIAQYLKMLRAIDFVRIYEDMFMDAQMVIVKVWKECCALMGTGNEQRVRMVLLKAVSVLVDCPAKMLLVREINQPSAEDGLEQRPIKAEAE